MEALEKTRPETVEGRGKIFANLGLADAEEFLAKARLAKKISEIIEGRRLTQAKAAEMLETTQPNVSNLVNGRLQGFSMERLLRFLKALDRDIQIIVKPRSGNGGRPRFTVELT